jgi:hypothetical protein
MSYRCRRRDGVGGQRELDASLMPVDSVINQHDNGRSLLFLVNLLCARISRSPKSIAAYEKGDWTGW